MRVEHLADDREWRRLLHYKPRLFGGVESQADGPAFFAAPDGKTNPEAELEATLAGFFAPVSADPLIQHAQCKFPARMLWLQSRLAFDWSRLPMVDCPRFKAFVEHNSAKSVTLVFSSYYMNNPASAFGHTFLRINKTDGASGESKAKLLDSGVDYSATVTDDNAVIYAFKGLTGMYKGQFNRYPYYYKVQEYGAFESRDLWEYDLNFTPSQVELLVAHLWELGFTWADYYYLTGNCSYFILTVLEAANPELELTDNVGVPVIPSNTIKALFMNPGLVKEVHYRPSIRTVFRARAKTLTNAQLDWVEKLNEDPEVQLPTDWSPTDKVKVLDAASDLLDFRYAKELVKGSNPAAAQRKQRLLERRSEILVPSEDLVVTPSPLIVPHEGHDSMRLSAAPGYSTQTGAFGSLEFRLAFHDLADPPTGYPELSQVEFLPMELRFNEVGRRLWLETASIVDVTSLTPLDRFDQHLSWHMNVGAVTLRDRGCPGCLAGTLEVGDGASVGWGSNRFVIYLMADGQLSASPHLHGEADLPVRLSVGPLAGARLRITDSLIALASGTFQWAPFSAPPPSGRRMPRFDGRLLARLQLACRAMQVSRTSRDD